LPAYRLLARLVTATIKFGTLTVPFVLVGCTTVVELNISTVSSAPMDVFPVIGTTILPRLPSSEVLLMIGCLFVAKQPTMAMPKATTTRFANLFFIFNGFFGWTFF
jgi:hypothetical protein